MHKPTATLALLAVLVSSACRERAQPAAPDATAAPVRADPAAADSGSSATHPSASAAPSTVALAPSATAPPASASASLLPGGSAPVAPPVLLDAAGEPLPQTDERPAADSAWAAELGPTLFAAIVADDAELALPHFFPVVAYAQVKAIENPARDWEARLVRNFRRDVHEYHVALGRDRERARYEGLEIPEERARLMKPGAEGNRLAYWRVLRSQLVYRDAGDHVRRLEVTSLISWRGEWYLVHLHGFQ
jgi:hypothetical protein